MDHEVLQAIAVITEIVMRHSNVLDSVELRVVLGQLDLIHKKVLGEGDG